MVTDEILRQIGEALGVKGSDPMTLLDAARNQAHALSVVRGDLADARMDLQAGSMHCRTCRWYRPWCAYGQAEAVGDGIGCGSWEGW